MTQDTGHSIHLISVSFIMLPHESRLPRYRAYILLLQVYINNITNVNIHLISFYFMCNH